jgi:hypothetical protein
MPTSPRGIVYPDSSGHTRIWDHLHDMATSIDAALPGQWVNDLESAVGYNMSVTATAAGTLITTGGPYNVTVPTGRELEVEFRAPLQDTPAGTGIVTLLLIGGVVKDGCYQSNSGAAAYAGPANLHGVVIGTGAAVAIRVEAYKVGGGTPSIQGAGIAPVRIRHRIN